MSGSAGAVLALTLLLWVGTTAGDAQWSGDQEAQWQRAAERFHAHDFERAAREFRQLAPGLRGEWTMAAHLNAARAEGAAAQRYLELGADWLLQPAFASVERAQDDLLRWADAGVQEAEVQETLARLRDLDRALEARVRELRSREAARTEAGGDPAPSGDASSGGAGSSLTDGQAPRVIGPLRPVVAPVDAEVWGQARSEQDRQRVREVLARILEERRMRLADRPLPTTRDGGAAW